jgi:hypothetical protein
MIFFKDERWFEPSFAQVPGTTKNLYPDHVWIPIDVYFSKPVADAGTPADYTVIFDRDGDFSTKNDQVQVIPDGVSIRQKAFQVPGTKRNRSGTVMDQLVK